MLIAAIKRGAQLKAFNLYHTPKIKKKKIRI